ncbi:MAG: DAK2 domain-containing protein [Clostridiales bacterium]|nr:DAK2 domain-containing protein [Candidatus Apopatousia equi]
MQKSINGATLRKMLIGGSALLNENKSYVDSLNVFPVPDGDTGTNMSLTMKSVVTEINSCPNNNIDELCEAFTKGALRGARGNSGVILSQILKGIGSSLRTETEITAKVFAKALNVGAEVAYKAVTKPKEGTILTVVRMMAESATKIAKKNIDVDEFLKQVINIGEETLQKTPELLPVLKKAGVVDSGGRGLIIIFTGFYKVLINDDSLKINYEQIDQVKDDLNVDFGGANPANIQDLGDIQFAYCTEYFIIEMKKKTTEADIDKLREKLCEIGDSVICVGDLSLVKVHVHTNEPNKALGYALELGELTKLKIENMLEQNRALKKAREQAKELKPYGMVSVCAGAGISAIFKDLNVDNVIEGGQTMNPSADDIAKAVDAVGAKDVYVFPNNKNIILASEQAKALTNKVIHVIPTKSIPEGISAAISFNPELAPMEIEDAMLEAIKNVHSSSITYAVRNTKVNGFSLKEGDIIGLNDKAIIAKGKNVDEAALKVVEKQVNEDISTITLFYGEGITEEQANALVEKLQIKYPSLEISALNGGQPVYYYLISME